MIGAGVMVVARFVVYKRHYLLKDYIRSGLYGMTFGALYSPFFLSKKTDNFKLALHLQQTKKSG
jgi:hypothetical protein